MRRVSTKPGRRVSTKPGARDGAVSLKAASDSAGDADLSSGVSPERIHREGRVRLAAIIDEWQQARDALRGG